MNRQGPGKIDWTDWTWNPVTGCEHACWYCAAASMARRFPEKFQNFQPTFHPDRLKEPLAKKARPGSRIFVTFQGDLLGEWVPKEWIEAVLDTVSNCGDLTFQFLTKNPSRYHQFKWPDNAWLGTSVANVRDAERVRWLLTDAVLRMPVKRWISVAPALDIEPQHIGLPALRALDWIVLEPIHGRSRRMQAASEDLIRYWVKRWKTEFSRVPIFVKGMRTAWENSPQMYPEVKR